MFYKKLLRPLLFNFDPEFIHKFTVDFALKYFPFIFIRDSINDNPDLSVNLFGLDFPNRIGLAAGMDKEAVALKAWENLGFGFAEIGTVTYSSQKGNAKPRLFRLPEEESILNYMGMNNSGAKHIAENLQNIYKKIKIPIGINIAKSANINPNNREAVIADLLNCLKEVHNYGDYLVLNLSCPNVANPEDFQNIKNLSQIIKPLKETTHLPFLIKISADVDEEYINNILTMCVDLNLQGIVATNTTKSRENTPNWTHNKAGGISGKLLAEKSLKITQYIGKHKPSNLALISVGGIFSADDTKERLDAGADLIQIYTSFIYEGIDLISKINKKLSSSGF